LSFVRKITDSLLNEIKAILREFADEAEVAIKKRLRKILITGIILGVLASLVISLLGAAAIFILIGSLEYLETFLPAWQSWDIMGLISGVVAGLLFLVLFLILRKQLRTP
jgi:hypothetical protein